MEYFLKSTAPTNSIYYLMTNDYQTILSNTTFIAADSNSMKDSNKAEKRSHTFDSPMAKKGRIKFTPKNWNRKST